MTISRKKLRDITLKLLFEQDFYEDSRKPIQCERFLDRDDLLAEDMEEAADKAPKFLSEEDKKFIRDRYLSILEHIPELDMSLNEKTTSWKTNRMNKIDLAILRLSLFEIRYDSESPYKVAVNEAVELAKRYGGDDSPKFVNGVLSKFYEET